MIILLRILFLLAISAAPLAAAETTATTTKAPPFPQEGSDLQPDPAALFGTLPNGLRYVVRPNHEPKGRASLRLLVLAGSLQETDEQRGLAHFLEHMAFNGSKHYPPGTLVEFFQRMGMSFGGDTNANTSFDRTIYLLELPQADKATLAEGLRVFGDYAGGLLLTDAEIDQGARHHSVSEKRASDSVQFRTFVAQFEACSATRCSRAHSDRRNRKSSRRPSATASSISGTRGIARKKWRVVVVGDFDAGRRRENDHVRVFATGGARRPRGPTRVRRTVATFDGVRAHQFHPEPEAPSTNLSITSLTPFAHEPDTAARQLKYSPARPRDRDAQPPFFHPGEKGKRAVHLGGRVGDRRVRFLPRLPISMSTCKPEQWSAALAVGEQELRRALEHGFSPAS